jgi:flagellar hook-associated protein 1 FlgK
VSLLSTLGNASTALQVFSRAIDIEGGNVANAATPGYAAVRATIRPIGDLGGSLGSDYVSVSSAADARGDSRAQAAASDASYSQARVELLEPLNGLFDITGATGLLAAFQNFSSAFGSLAVAPNDATLQESALGAVGRVAAAFQKAAESLDQQRSQIDSAINGVADEINKLSTQIRDANVQIRGSSEPNPAQDAVRRNALDALASLVDIQVIAAPDGSVTVLTGRQQPLVIGDRTFTLSADPAAAPPNQVRTAGGGNSPGTYGGKLGAVLDIRNNSLSALIGDETKPGSLNTLAAGFASRVNELLTSGVTSSGTPGTPVFLYDAGAIRDAARSLKVDPLLTGSQLAVASTGTDAQSNGIANALTRLFGSTSEADHVGGSSFQNVFGTIAASVGQELASAREQASTTSSALTAAAAARERISGVSLDQSAIAITSLQRFYQASAKLVSILDTLTTTEINLIR